MVMNSSPSRRDGRFAGLLVLSLIVHVAILAWGLPFQRGDVSRVNEFSFRLISLEGVATPRELRNVSVTVPASTPVVSAAPSGVRGESLPAIASAKPPSASSDSTQFLEPSGLDQVAELLVPLDGALFVNAQSVSGKLVFEAAVRRDGTLADIRIVSGDATETFAMHMLEWFKDKKFNPAWKNGARVDSLLRFEFSLGEYQSQRTELIAKEKPDAPRLDEKGNIVRSVTQDSRVYERRTQ
jgi:Gram-negative bacterial TonB protein C-terminal